jgi:hypothetical protein
MPDFFKQFSTDVQFEAELVYIAFRASIPHEAEVHAVTFMSANANCGRLGVASRSPQNL